MEKFIRILKETIEKIYRKFHADKKLSAVVVLLVSGIVLLCASEFREGDKTSPVQSEQTTEYTDVSDYPAQLESRLVSIISSIDGAGETKVMVTLDNSGEDIYLHDFDYGENNDPSGKNSVERKDEYVIIDGSSGEQGIIVRKAEPEIRGVAVVCEGGGSEYVRAQVIQTVTALLDISSARVSVAKMS